jgi:probable HAF family extracellular repeat protein
MGVSGNGEIVVGYSSSGFGNQAFRWSPGGTMIGLGDLPGGGFYSLGLGVSSDGAVVVGQGEIAGGMEAFRWTQGTGMVGLAKFQALLGEVVHQLLCWTFVNRHRLLPRTQLLVLTNCAKIRSAP